MCVCAGINMAHGAQNKVVGGKGAAYLWEPN